MGTALCLYTLGDGAEGELGRYLWRTTTALWEARRLGVARLLVEMGADLQPAVVARDVADGLVEVLVGWGESLAASLAEVVGALWGGWGGEQSGMEERCGGKGETGNGN